MRDIMEIVSFNLKRLRGLKKWTQQDLADASGVHMGTIRSYEAQVRWPSLEFIRLVATALGVHPKEFFRDPEEATTIELPNHERQGLVNSISKMVQDAIMRADHAHPRTRHDKFCTKLCEMAYHLSDESRDSLLAFASDLLESNRSHQPSRGKTDKRR